MFMESEICLERTQFIDQLGAIYLLMFAQEKVTWWKTKNKTKNKDRIMISQAGGVDSI